MSGYIYEVFDLTTGSSLGWWPFDTTLSKAKFEYTILTKDSSGATVIDNINLQNAWVKLYPNPVSDNQTLQIITDEIADLRISLFDLQGRKLREVFRGKTNTGKKLVYTNVSDLAPAVYFYEIKLGDKRTHIRFIKQ